MTEMKRVIIHYICIALALVFSPFFWLAIDAWGCIFNESGGNLKAFYKDLFEYIESGEEFGPFDKNEK